MPSDAEGRVPNLLMIPAGVDDWYDYTFMHRDYFAANRRVFDSKLLDLCLYNAPDSIAIADPKRG